MADKSSAQIIVEDVALTGKALEALHEHFDHPTKNSRALANDALRFTGMQARVIASRTNQAAVILGTAKAMGLQGDALGPLWSELTGTDAKKFLPAPSEPSTGGESASG